MPSNTWSSTSSTEYGLTTSMKAGRAASAAVRTGATYNEHRKAPLLTKKGRQAHTGGLLVGPYLGYLPMSGYELRMQLVIKRQPMPRKVVTCENSSQYAHKPQKYLLIKTVFREQTTGDTRTADRC